MSSLRHTISSRTNGARFKGAITPAGKIRLSRNATRHGLLAKCIVREIESREGFDSLLSAVRFLQEPNAPEGIFTKRSHLQSLTRTKENHLYP